MSDAKLLPCPFCGKEPIVNHIGSSAPHVTCYDPRTNHGQCAASAWVTLETWNRRAPLAPSPEKPTFISAHCGKCGDELNDNDLCAKCRPMRHISLNAPSEEPTP